MIEAGFCNDKIGEYRYTIVLLRLPYAGAEYTTSFSDNFKSKIFTQLFGDEALSGAYKSYYQYHSKTGCDDTRWIVEIQRPDMVDQPRSAANCASHVPSLKALAHRASEAVTAAVSLGNSQLSVPLLRRPVSPGKHTP